MNRKKYITPLVIAGAVSFIYFGIGNLVGIPEFFKGLLIGICLVCYTAACLSNRITRTRRWKKGLIQKISIRH